MAFLLLHVINPSVSCDKVMMHLCEPFRSGTPHAYCGAPCTPVEERCSKGRTDFLKCLDNQILTEKYNNYIPNYCAHNGYSQEALIEKTQPKRHITVKVKNHWYRAETWCTDFKPFSADLIRIEQPRLAVLRAVTN